MMRWSIAAGAAAVLGLLFAAPAARADDGWTWPVHGRVITTYANDNARPYAGGMHRGIDIAAAVGTPIVAARAGDVTFAGPLGSSGNVVAVRTEDGRYVTSYLHLAVVSIGRGARVPAGGRLGEVGTTGQRSVPEPHLHFGVRLADTEDRYVDPLGLLPPPGAAQAPAGVPAVAPVPVRAQEAPAAVLRVPAARHVVRPRLGAQPQRLRPRGTVAPGPVAAPAAPAVGVSRAPAQRRRAARAVPAGRAPELSPGYVRHPVAVPTAAVRPAVRPGHARPLLWAGLGLVAVVLFGGALVRLNARINSRAAAIAAVLRRARGDGGRSARAGGAECS